MLFALSLGLTLLDLYFIGFLIISGILANYHLGALGELKTLTKAQLDRRLDFLNAEGVEMILKPIAQKQGFILHAQVTAADRKIKQEQLDGKFREWNIEKDK